MASTPTSGGELMATSATTQTTATATAANRLANEQPRGLNEVAAHELGHVIAHIVTETYFYSVWVAGVNQCYDKQYDVTKMAGCVSSYQHGKMAFDGERVRC